MALRTFVNWQGSDIGSRQKDYNDSSIDQNTFYSSQSTSRGDKTSTQTPD